MKAMLAAPLSLALALPVFAADPAPQAAPASPATPATPAAARTAQPDPALRQRATEAQRQAMAGLARFDGVWRGPATVLTPSGQKVTMTQTERFGPMLEGTLRVMEGRGYAPDGKLVFNAFAVVGYDAARKAYRMQTYTLGGGGDVPFQVTPDGFEWQMTHNGMTTRYKASVNGTTWTETGERIVAGKAPERFFEMTLTRVGDNTWPAGGAVPPR